MGLKIRKYDLFGKKTDLVYMIILYVLTLTVHLTVALRMKMLHMSHDEMGVLATAAYAVGEDWSAIVSKFGYYGYGSAILYIPIFALTKGPVLRYRLITALNSCFMALIPVIAYHIARKYCKAEKNTAFFAAAVTGLYPGYLLFSKWVWNETMMCLLPWVTALLMFRLFFEQNKKLRVVFSLLLSLTLVYSYAVHSRALGLIAAAVLVIALVWIFQRRLIVEPISFCSSFAVLFTIDHFVKKYIQEHLWLTGENGDMANTVGGNTGKLHDYTNAEGFRGLLRITAGQLSAASASTYGLLAIAIAAGIPLIFKGMKKNQRIRKGRQPDEKHAMWLLMTMTALFFAGALAISALFLGNEGRLSQTRGDYYVYTRYFSNTLGFAVFAVFIYFAKNELSSRMAAVMAAVYAALAFPMIHYADFINQQHSSSNATILNLLAYLGYNPKDYVSHFDFRTLLIVTTVVFGAAIIAFSGKKQNLFAILLCLVSLESYYRTSDIVILGNTSSDFSYVQPTFNALEKVDGLEDEYDSVYYYNVHQAKPWSSSAMQFALPEYEVTEFNFEISPETDPEQLFGFITENSIIVSSEDIGLEKFSPDIYRLEYDSINYGKEYMWVYGGDVKDYIVENSDIRVAEIKE
jgi:hypothetical protein